MKTRPIYALRHITYDDGGGYGPPLIPRLHNNGNPTGSFYFYACVDETRYASVSNMGWFDDASNIFNGNYDSAGAYTVGTADTAKVDAIDAQYTQQVAKARQVYEQYCNEKFVWVNDGRWTNGPAWVEQKRLECLQDAQTQSPPSDWKTRLLSSYRYPYCRTLGAKPGATYAATEGVNTLRICPTLSSGEKTFCGMATDKYNTIAGSGPMPYGLMVGGWIGCFQQTDFDSGAAVKVIIPVDCSKMKKTCEGTSLGQNVFTNPDAAVKFTKAADSCPEPNPASQDCPFGCETVSSTDARCCAEDEEKAPYCKEGSADKVYQQVCSKEFEYKTCADNEQCRNGACYDCTKEHKSCEGDTVRPNIFAPGSTLQRKKESPPCEDPAHPLTPENCPFGCKDNGDGQASCCADEPTERSCKEEDISKVYQQLCGEDIPVEECEQPKTCMNGQCLDCTKKTSRCEGGAPVENQAGLFTGGKVVKELTEPACKKEGQEPETEMCESYCSKQSETSATCCSATAVSCKSAITREQTVNCGAQKIELKMPCPAGQMCQAGNCAPLPPGVTLAPGFEPTRMTYQTLPDGSIRVIYTIAGQPDKDVALVLKKGVEVEINGFDIKITRLPNPGDLVGLALQAFNKDASTSIRLWLEKVTRASMAEDMAKRAANDEEKRALQQLAKNLRKEAAEFKKALKAGYGDAITPPSGYDAFGTALDAWEKKAKQYGKTLTGSPTNKDSEAFYQVWQNSVDDFVNSHKPFREDLAKYIDTASMSGGAFAPVTVSEGGRTFNLFVDLDGKMKVDGTVRFTGPDDQKTPFTISAGTSTYVIGDSISANGGPAKEFSIVQHVDGSIQYGASITGTYTTQVIPLGIVDKVPFGKDGVRNALINEPTVIQLGLNYPLIGWPATYSLKLNLPDYSDNGFIPSMVGDRLGQEFINMLKNNKLNGLTGAINEEITSKTSKIQVFSNAYINRISQTLSSNEHVNSLKTMDGLSINIIEQKMTITYTVVVHGEQYSGGPISITIKRTLDK